MFQFPRLPLHNLWIQLCATRHDPSEVSPFGHPRIKACEAAPRGLSQPSTSFVVVLCQGIPYVRLSNFLRFTPPQKWCRVTRKYINVIPCDFCAFRGWQQVTSGYWLAIGKHQQLVDLLLARLNLLGSFYGPKFLSYILTLHLRAHKNIDCRSEKSLSKPRRCSRCWLTATGRTQTTMYSLASLTGVIKHILM